jgi:RimJ/RimL family protein N-acetyltransferase
VDDPAASPIPPAAAPVASPAASPAAPNRWPDDLVLREGDLVLRRWRTEDAAAISVACQDPEISRWIPVIPQTYGLADAVEFLAEAADEWRAGSSRAFAIVDVRDGLLGAVTLHGPEGHLAEIGYWLAPDARGRGIATRAVRLLTRHAFRAEPALVRIGLRTLRGNDASARVAERCGFTLEGTLRSLEPVRGAFADVVIYSLLRDEAFAR